MTSVTRVPKQRSLGTSAGALNDGDADHSHRRNLRLVRPSLEAPHALASPT